MLKLNRLNNLLILGLIVSVMVIFAGFISLDDVYAAIVHEGQTGETGNINWTIDDEGTLTISGKGAPKIYDESPEWLNFSDEISKVVVEEGITGIGERWIYNLQNLTEISLPSTLKTIDDDAIRYCTKVKEIVFPAKIVNLNSDQFSQMYGVEKIVFLGDIQKVDLPMVEGGKTPQFYVLPQYAGKKVDCKYKQLTAKIICDVVDGEVVYDHKTPQRKIKLATTSEDGYKDKLVCNACGGTVEEKTVIPAASIVKLSSNVLYYDGSEKKPEVIVRYDKSKKIDKSNYDVIYPDDTTNVGKYTAKVKFKNDYTGTVKLSYEVKAPEINYISGILKKGYSVKLVINGGCEKPVWTSSNPSVATVSTSGNVKALKMGTCIITASFDGMKKTCRITVPDPTFDKVLSVKDKVVLKTSTYSKMSMDFGDYDYWVENNKYNTVVYPIKIKEKTTICIGVADKHNSIVLGLKDSNEKILFKKTKPSKGYVKTITLNPGEYTLCVKNYGRSKLASYELRVFNKAKSGLPFLSFNSEADMNYMNGTFEFYNASKKKTINRIEATVYGYNSSGGSEPMGLIDGQTSKIVLKKTIKPGKIATIKKKIYCANYKVSSVKFKNVRVYYTDGTSKSLTIKGKFNRNLHI